jgi:hypothetical protein
MAVLNFRWRPERVSGMPIARESRPLAAERPIARFHEKLKPYVRLLRIEGLTNAI